jgi:hypothetical protein
MDSMDPLGKVLLTCANRSRLEVSRRMGLSFWGMTAFNTVVLSFVAAGIVVKLAGIPPPQMYHPVFQLTLAAAAVLVVAGSIHIGRTSSKRKISAHEYGIRFGRIGVRYDEIASIHLGFDPGHWLAKVTRFSEAMAQIPIQQSQNRATASLMRMRGANSVTVMLRSGKSVLLNDVCLVVVEEDLDAFFEIFERKCPGMLDSVEDGELEVSDETDETGETDDSKPAEDQ